MNEHEKKDMHDTFRNYVYRNSEAWLPDDDERLLIHNLLALGGTYNMRYLSVRSVELLEQLQRLHIASICLDEGKELTNNDKMLCADIKLKLTTKLKILEKPRFKSGDMAVSKTLNAIVTVVSKPRVKDGTIVVDAMYDCAVMKFEYSDLVPASTRRMNMCRRQQ